MTSDAAIVIGAGHAGAELALQLREQGWPGPILLVGEEHHLPYHRPPLSKGFLTGAVAADQFPLRPAAAYEKAQVTRMPGRQVTAIDLANRTVTLDDRAAFAWSGLALATGARPRPLRLPGMEVAPPNLHMLRTIEDGIAIRQACADGARVAIVGGGYIGLEVAASAVALGARVSVLEALPRVLSRVTGSALASFVEDTHRSHGVDLRTGVTLRQALLDASGRVTALECADGQRVDCDLVVAGIGIEPEVALARAAGLAVDDGIVVDEDCRTSAPGVVAAGDCTRHPSALYARQVRLESVSNALGQARTAAATLAGKARPYREAPWFWSDQFDLKLKSVGLCAGHDDEVVRGDPARRTFSVFYLQAGRVLAVDTVNQSADFLAGKRIVAEGIRIPREALADPTRPLKEFLPAA